MSTPAATKETSAPGAACLNCGGPVPAASPYSECQKCREGRFPRLADAGTADQRSVIYREAYQRGEQSWVGHIRHLEAGLRRQKEIAGYWHGKYEQVARENNALRRRWVVRAKDQR